MPDNTLPPNTGRPPSSRRTIALLFSLLVVGVVCFAAGLGTGYLLFKPPPVLEQQGTFQSLAGQEGTVNFPIPYTTTPEIQLHLGSFNRTAIIDATPTGFRWKNTGPDDLLNNAEVQWASRGLR